MIVTFSVDAAHEGTTVSVNWIDLVKFYKALIVPVIWIVYVPAKVLSLVYQATYPSLFLFGIVKMINVVVRSGVFESGVTNIE